MKRSYILVIDDEPEITDIIKAFLSNAGYKVEVENSPTEGLEKAKKLKPDLVLLDIMMPVMDGYQATREIRLLEEKNNLTRVAIIALTANALKGDPEKTAEAGMDDFLSKPFTSEELQDMIDKWFSLDDEITP